MKKVVSFLLTILLLLNVMGYYGLFLGLKYTNTKTFNQQLDAENYRADQAEVIKVPLAIPYLSDTDFERVNGEIEYHGNFYQLIKQKYAQDTLYIVCIKDLKSKQLKQALADYVKIFSDHTGDAHHGNVAPSFIKDYLPVDIDLCHAAFGWNYQVYFFFDDALIALRSLSLSSPPPEAA